MENPVEGSIAGVGGDVHLWNVVRYVCFRNVIGVSHSGHLDELRTVWDGGEEEFPNGGYESPEAEAWVTQVGARAALERERWEVIEK